MNKSNYLEELIEECNKTRKIIAKKTLNGTIIFIIISVIAYVGLTLLDPRTAYAAIMLSSIFGLMGFIFLIKFLLLSGEISNKVLIECQHEIEKNLVLNETFETFYNDITTPAFGDHIINGSKVRVGHTFVLFQSLTPKGPHFKILRGDNLGQFDVHYFSQHGDIGVDINNKDGKFIRSVMTSNKDQFYKLLNALESIKSYANGEDIPMEQASGKQDNEFVGELKNKVSNKDKRDSTRFGVGGILFGIFLFIASSNSGEIFAYIGGILILISIIFLIGVNIKFKKQ